MDTLYTKHNRSLNILYADVERHSHSQTEVFVGTPGSVIERTNSSGFRFYAHQYYNVDGKQIERYLAGPVGSPEAEATASRVRRAIDDIKDLIPSLRLLIREEFQSVDTKTYATVAALHNQGVFAAGGMLVGSHAYGVILNRMGVRSAEYATEDIDVARREALAFEKTPDKSFVEMLRDSGIDFTEVPGLNRKRPSTSFKESGRSRFHVDLLAPSHDESFPVVPVPELKAHAVGLPYLGYLLAESQMGAVVAREGCCAVRVPLPERFAVHKLVISRLRTGRAAKIETDLLQASVLCAALAEMHPGALQEASARLPKKAQKHLRRGLEAARPLLAQHPRVFDELS
jgi:hypothetical protein